MKREGRSVLGTIVHGAFVVIGSLTFTAGFFLVLPVVQAIAANDKADTIVQTADTAALPPPPPPIEEEPEPEPVEEEEPPELKQQLPPLDLSQLDLALDPGGSEGWGGSLSFNLDLTGLGGGSDGALFGEGDLDQKPRVLYQASPILDSKLRKRAPGSVRVVFVVDEQGRVKDPRVLKSSDPIFEKAALSAVSQWKFEPGKRNGKPVQFRMRVTISFPASS